MMNPMFERASSMLVWFASAEGEVFLKDCLRLRNIAYDEVKESKDVILVGRAQGELIAYDRILSLPDQLREHLKKVKSGERKGGI